MTIAEVCNRNVVHAPASTTVMEAARLMRERHVGSVVVVDEGELRRTPIGIVTDRDITIAVVALGLDAAVIRIADVMAQRFACVQGDWEVSEVIQVMQAKGVRRMVVVGADGSLEGIVTADDIVSRLADQLILLSGIATVSRERESRLRHAVS
jgi:CBS domain-containing protein